MFYRYIIWTIFNMWKYYKIIFQIIIRPVRQIVIAMTKIKISDIIYLYITQQWNKLWNIKKKNISKNVFPNLYKLLRSHVNTNQLGYIRTKLFCNAQNKDMGYVRVC